MKTNPPNVNETKILMCPHCGAQNNRTLMTWVWDSISYAKEECWYCGNLFKWLPHNNTYIKV